MTMTHKAGMLNAVLSHLLKATSVHAIHARVLKFQGNTEFADTLYKQYIDDMKYADRIIEWMLHQNIALKSIDLDKLYIGNNVNEIADLEQAALEKFLIDIDQCLKSLHCQQDEEVKCLLHAIQDNIQAYLHIIDSCTKQRVYLVSARN